MQECGLELININSKSIEWKSLRRRMVVVLARGGGHKEKNYRWIMWRLLFSESVWKFILPLDGVLNNKWRRTAAQTWFCANSIRGRMKKRVEMLIRNRELFLWDQKAVEEEGEEGSEGSPSVVASSMVLLVNIWMVSQLINCSVYGGY